MVTQNTVIEIIPATPEEVAQAELKFVAWQALLDTPSYVEEEALRFTNTPVLQVLAEEARARG
jgi:hypothetical protein